MLLLSLITLYYSFGKPVEVRKARPKPQVIITPSLPREGSVTPQKRKKSPSPAPQNNAPTPTDGVPLQFACKVCGRYVLAFYNSSVLFCLVIGSLCGCHLRPARLTSYFLYDPLSAKVYFIEYCILMLHKRRM